MPETKRTQHTPTPWTFEKGLSNFPDNKEVTDDSVGTIFSKYYLAEIYWIKSAPDALSREEAEANAEYIVTACNAHDKLKASLREMLRLFDRGLPDKSIGRETCDIAREVLAELEKSDARI